MKTMGGAQNRKPEVIEPVFVHTYVSLVVQALTLLWTRASWCFIFLCVVEVYYHVPIK